MTTQTLEKPKTCGKYLCYTDGEIEILRQYYNGKKQSVELIMRFIKSTYGIDRTNTSVRHKALELGLTNHRKKTWQAEEDRKLEDLVGKYTYCKIAKLMGRSIHSVQGRANRLGLDNVTKNGWYSLSDVVSILGVWKNRVTVWIKTGRLKATPYGDTAMKSYKILQRDLREFCLKYPMELTGRNVDLVQYNNIVCPAYTYKDN